ncbi:hypothetical protein TNCV_2640031 [Trichonephila clavipes]|nr:hypothetical protein TNCV_2640031 [Trichonephila clavipes]
MRYCRERKAVFDNSPKPPTELRTLALKKKYADQTLLAVLKSQRPIPNTSNPRRHIKRKTIATFQGVRKVGLSEKLLRRYFGPYQVLRRLSAVTYEVQDFDPASRKRKLREEVRLVNQTQESLDSDPQSLDRSRRIERVLAPVSTKPTETRPRPTFYRAPVQKFPRKTH